MKVILTIILLIGCSFACTDFKFAFRYGNQTCIASGRSMDYPVPQGSICQLINRNTFFQSIAPDGSNGISWNTKYGYLGITALTNHTIVDGMNEKGLTCAILMLGETVYPTLTPNQYKNSLEGELICPFALGNFANVKDLASGLRKVKIWQNTFLDNILIPPVHIQFHDAYGDNLVVEFLNGTMILYDNQIGVMTNDPPLPYHWNNIKQYNSLTQYQPSNVYINGHLINGTDIALGTLGLPGDATAISRYVRISKMIQFMGDTNGFIHVPNYMDGITAGIHLLHKVDVLHGEALYSFMDFIRADTSIWQVIRDSTNRIFYYFTYEDTTVRAIDLSSINFNSTTKWNSFFIGIPEKQQVMNMTSQFF